MLMHTDDDLHVILDALDELLGGIDRGGSEPWVGYDDEPKNYRDGYLAVLHRAREGVERELSAQRGLRFSQSQDWDDPNERLTCDTCGRVGSRDDGIEPGGPCQEPCDGTVRRV